MHSEVTMKHWLTTQSQCTHRLWTTRIAWDTKHRCLVELSFQGWYFHPYTDELLLALCVLMCAQPHHLVPLSSGAHPPPFQVFSSFSPLDPPLPSPPESTTSGCIFRGCLKSDPAPVSLKHWDPFRISECSRPADTQWNPAFALSLLSFLLPGKIHST